jgi:DNA-binding PadR family transcriptional regulator
MSDPNFLVLASLADGEKHGYAMMEDIERFAGVRLGPGTLYGAIARLEERGWIEPLDSDDRRRPYRITTAGRDHLESQASALSKISKTALGRLRHA